MNLLFDPQAGVLVQMWGRQIVIHHRGVYTGQDTRQENWYAHGQACWHNFAYSRYSRDLGRTWSEPQKLIYEDGDPFDPEQPCKPSFINHNEGGCGNNILVRRDGTLLTCLSTANAPGDAKNNDRVWKYSDGTDFYSPSSYHRTIRHSITAKLYWLGNITADPPHGNDPRYPLIIAEVDEAEAALKESTVTTIDDRGPAQGQGIQFSSFSLLEDRQTHAIELYLTTYGQEADPDDGYTADNYKYTLQLK